MVNSEEVQSGSTWRSVQPFQFDYGEIRSDKNSAKLTYFATSSNSTMMKSEVRKRDQVHREQASSNSTMVKSEVRKLVLA